MGIPGECSTKKREYKPEKERLQYKDLGRFGALAAAQPVAPVVPAQAGIQRAE